MKDLNIKLNIAGRVYAFTIDREDEEIYRLAEQEINKCYTSLKMQWSLDHEGGLALAALQIAMKGVRMAASHSLGEDIDTLAKLDTDLDRYLNDLK